MFDISKEPVSTDVLWVGASTVSVAEPGNQFDSVLCVPLFMKSSSKLLREAVLIGSVSRHKQSRSAEISTSRNYSFLLSSRDNHILWILYCS